MCRQQPLSFCLEYFLFTIQLIVCFQTWRVDGARGGQVHPFDEWNIDPYNLQLKALVSSKNLFTFRDCSKFALL